MHFVRLAVRATVAHAGHPPVVHQRPEHLGAAHQRERRLLLGSSGQQLEEIPLRHQRDVFVTAGKPPQDDVDRLALHLHADVLDEPVRHLLEPRAQAELVEQLQRARVHGVTAEVT